MRVELGINTCFAVKRWPRPEDWARVVRDDLGLNLVELSLDLLDGSETASGRERVVEANRAALEWSGLTARGTFTGLVAYSRNLLLHPDPLARAEALRWYHDVIDLSAELGVAGTGGHVGALSAPDWADPAAAAERWRGLKADLETLTGHARSAGLTYFLVENLVPVREPSDTARIEDLLTRGDSDHVPIGLCLDLGHECVPGSMGAERDPYAWLARFGGRVIEVQLQQSDAEGDNHWPFTPERNRRGRIDADRVLQVLNDAGAGDVTLMLEVIPSWEQPDAEVVADLVASVEYWRSGIARAGLDVEIRR